MYSYAAQHVIWFARLKLNVHFPLLTKPDFSKRIEKKGYRKVVQSNLAYFHGLRPAADA